MEKKNDYIKFIYEIQDQELVNILEEYLNQKKDDIFAFFDSNLERRDLIIKIIPTKKEYDQINMKRKGVDSIPDWSIGNYHDNTIEYVSFNDYQNTAHKYPKDKYEEYLEYYKKTIVHEFTHYVLWLYIQKYTSTYPYRYLNEGIAQYLSSQRDNQVSKFNFSLDIILDNSSNKYLAWYLMTKYIVDTYGSDYFKKLIVDNNLALNETPRLYEEAKEFYNNYNKIR